jgi:hypothetical protein
MKMPCRRQRLGEDAQKTLALANARGNRAPPTAGIARSLVGRLLFERPNVATPSPPAPQYLNLKGRGFSALC